MNGNNQENQSLMMLKIFWGALLMSQAMFGLVLFTLLQNQEPLSEISTSVVSAVVSAAFGSWIVGYILPGFILKDKRMPPATPIDDLAKIYQVPFILKLALFESATLIGFALAFLVKDFNYFVPFLSVNAVNWVINFPSEENIKKAFKTNQVTR